MNYQLRPLCVPVVPLHAETVIVRIDSAHTYVALLYFRSIEICMEKLEMGITSVYF